MTRTKEEAATYARQWRTNNNEQWQNIKARSRCNRIITAQAILGGQCVECGESDPAVLEFDHINNDGKEHRKETGRVPIVDWILRNQEEALERLQLLCANCHARKHSVFKHCKVYYKITTT